jgi:hypothetical protein
MKRHSLQQVDHWSYFAHEILPDPAGEWFHELDPMWANMWCIGLFHYGNGVMLQERCRADVLLAVDRAFQAWEQLGMPTIVRSGDCQYGCDGYDKPESGHQCVWPDCLPMKVELR